MEQPSSQEASRPWQEASRPRRKSRFHLDASLGLVLLTLIAYCALARLVDNLYPFSTFPMYSYNQNSASRIIVRGARAAEHEIKDYDRWHCPEPLDPSSRACDDLKQFDRIAYLDQEIVDYLSSHSAVSPEGDPVTIIRKIWYLNAGKTETAYCPLQTCTARLIR